MWMCDEAAMYNVYLQNEQYSCNKIAFCLCFVSYVFCPFASLSLLHGRICAFDKSCCVSCKVTPYRIHPPCCHMHEIIPVEEQGALQHKDLAMVK